jgi:large subunit ribosomal protein L1
MKDVARVLGRFLGQSGKMPKPSPKGYGIVSPSEKIEKIIENYKRRIILSTKKAPIVQTVFGKKSIDHEQNKENLISLINFIESQLPNGQGNIKSIYLKTTMGKSTKVEEPQSARRGGRK